jgi:ABC-type antimicrobial peptide transport system permease subunit
MLLRVNKGIVDGLNLFSRTFGDPALYGELALVFIISALASLVPARRAARVDPMVALRHD